MNCTEVQQLIVEHCLNETSGQVSREIERHLANGCLECTQRFREVQQGTEAFFESVPVEHIDESRHEEWINQTLDRCRTYGSTDPNSIFQEAVTRQESDAPPSTLAQTTEAAKQDSSAARLSRLAAFAASLAAGVLFAAFLPAFLDPQSTKENTAKVDLELPSVGNDGFDLGSLPPAALPSGQASRLQASARSAPVFVSRGSLEETGEGSLVILRDHVAHQLHVFGRGFATGEKGSSFELHVRLANDSQARYLCPIVANAEGSFECVVDFSGGQIAEAFLTRPSR